MHTLVQSALTVCVILAIKVDSKGIDLNLCDETLFTCQCGTNSDTTVQIPIKQCTFFYKWKPSCKPCNKIKTKDVCPKYLKCFRCNSNNENDDGCTECPTGYYGNWCQVECRCENGGTCDRGGQCYCTDKFEGRFCEKSKAQLLSCPLPRQPANGHLSGSSYLPGSIIQFGCNDGFEMVGNKFIVCSLNGQWNSDPPICKHSSCEVPNTSSLPPNLRMEVQTSSSGGYGKQQQQFAQENIWFTCVPGYTIKGTDLMKCINGEWSSSIPACGKRCPNVADPENGDIVEKLLVYEPNSLITFTCHSGYQIVGSHSLKCGDDGVWSDAIPSCHPLVTCADPGFPIGGDREIFPPYIAGKATKFSCKSNSILFGESTVVCEENGQWSHPAPSCITVSDKLITCETAGSEVVGDPNQSIRMECPAGCLLNPSPIIGTVIYDSSSSVCKSAIHSGKLTDEGGAVAVINNGNYAGFVSSLINSISSQSKQEFSSSFRFSSLPPITFGDNGIILECPMGWKEVGDICVLIVEKKNVWSEANQICRNLDSSLVTLTNSTNLDPLFVGQDVDESYWTSDRCHYFKYNTSSSYSIVENEDGCQVVKKFMCQLRLLGKGAPCKDPGNIQNGFREVKNSVNGIFFEGSAIKYRCNEIYYLRGETLLTCASNSRWNHPLPVCRQIPACKELEVPLNTMIEYTKSARTIPVPRSPFIRSRLPFFDDNRFANPFAPRMSFSEGLPGPSNSTNSNEGEENFQIPSSHKKSGIRAVITCKSRFYRLTGSRVRTCKKNGRWSGRISSCNPICGVTSAPRMSFVVNGNASEVGQWPWQVAISRWSPKLQQNLLICGGSLLNENWFLTAAHCVTYRLMKTLIPNAEFSIYLGKHFRNNSYDDRFVQMKKIEAIHLHPNFDPIQFDNDIALVKLQTPVEFNSRVRPVCLSTFRSANKHLVQDSVGVVSGWGYTETKELSKELRYAKVQVQPNEKCQKSYREAGIPLTVTDNMFCAGYKEGKYDSCEGDSGGPMIFQDSATNKWILEGIVSWGSPEGCGLENQFGGYTRVERFLKWIQDYL